MATRVMALLVVFLMGFSLAKAPGGRISSAAGAHPNTAKTRTSSTVSQTGIPHRVVVTEMPPLQIPERSDIDWPGYLALVLSVITLYLQTLRKARLKIYTDERVVLGLNPDRNAGGQRLSLSLTVFNSGASHGRISDLVLVLDGLCTLIPDAGEPGGFSPVVVAAGSSEFRTVVFRYALLAEHQPQPAFDLRTFENGIHSYELRARFGDRPGWHVALQREFQEGLTTEFRRLRRAQFAPRT